MAACWGCANPHHLLHRTQKCGWLKRFLDELETCIQEFRWFNFSTAGHQDDRNQGKRSTHEARHREAVHFWHLNVRHQQVHDPTELVHKPEGLYSILRFNSVKAVCTEQGLDEVPDEWIVIDDQRYLLGNSAWDHGSPVNIGA
jgi:hypothetical protein